MVEACFRCKGGISLRVRATYRFGEGPGVLTEYSLLFSGATRDCGSLRGLPCSVVEADCVYRNRFGLALNYLLSTFFTFVSRSVSLTTVQV